MSAHSEFERAAIALVEAAGGRSFGRAEFDPLVRGLGRYLRAAFPTLEREEILDLIALTLERFFTAARAGRVKLELSPAAYATTIAGRAAIDALDERRRRRAVGERLEAAEIESDELERLVNVVSDEQRALELRERAQRSGKNELVELVDVYLSLAAEGRPTTFRELGLALGVSHTEVRLRLDELAALASVE